MKIKVCQIFSEVQQGSLFFAIAGSLDPSKYESSFIMVDKEPNIFFEMLVKQGFEAHHISFTGRKGIIRPILEMRRLLRRIQPDIVHTHLVNGSLVGLIGAALAGIRKRVSYRHHSNECHVYFPHAVYYDRLINFMSKYVIANTKMTGEILTEKERLDPAKLRVINYAYDLDSITASDASVQKLKERYGLTGRFPVVGVISRFVHWKGVQYVIPAFKKLLTKYPDAKLVLANADGAFKSDIEALLADNLTETQYIKIKFEDEIYALYKTFDVFVHVPVDKYVEAFGQIYVEALALQVPSVFTLSGVAPEFIVDGSNALVVPFCDSDAIHDRIKIILEDARLRGSLVEKGKSDVFRLFHSRRLGKELESVYSSL